MARKASVIRRRINSAGHAIVLVFDQDLGTAYATVYVDGARVSQVASKGISETDAIKAVDNLADYGDPSAPVSIEEALARYRLGGAVISSSDPGDFAADLARKAYYMRAPSDVIHPAG